MHDYFDVLGLASTAPANEIRRAFKGRVRRSHPDFLEDPNGVFANLPSSTSLLSDDAVNADVAIDFVDMTVFVDRIQAAFFRDKR